LREKNYDFLSITPMFTACTTKDVSAKNYQSYKDANGESASWMIYKYSASGCRRLSSSYYHEKEYFKTAELYKKACD
jgi:hypothetical protein